MGSEREYIEAAISEGFKILGFSDHTPQPYPDGFVSGIRMDMSELEDYTDTLVKLRDEYKDDIQILIGYEVEYTRKYFEPLLKELKKYPLDYIIQGQHFVEDEVDGFYCERHGRCHFEPLHKDVPDMPPYQEEVAQRRYQHSKHPDDQHDIQQPARLRHRLSVLGSVQLLRIVFHALHQRQLACLVLHIRSQRIYNFGLFGPDGRMIHDLRRVKVVFVHIADPHEKIRGQAHYHQRYGYHQYRRQKFIFIEPARVQFPLPGSLFSSFQ